MPNPTIITVQVTINGAKTAIQVPSRTGDMGAVQNAINTAEEQGVIKFVSFDQQNQYLEYTFKIGSSFLPPLGANFKSDYSFVGRSAPVFEDVLASAGVSIDITKDRMKMRAT